MCDVFTETVISHRLGSATGTQEHIKQSEPIPDEYASNYVATAWDGIMFPYSISASEDSDGTEVYGQQLDKSKKDKSKVPDVEDSLVTEGEHDKVEDKAEIDDIEDSNDSTEAKGGKVTEAVHNESKKAEKCEVSDVDAEEGKQSKVTEVVDNESKVPDAEKMKWVMERKVTK